MRILIQRVINASVAIENQVYSSIDKGYLVLVGIEEFDHASDIDYLANKIVNMRLFNDENKIMNLSIKDINGEILAVSQFTLHAQTKKGNRPSYIKAAKPDIAIPIYEQFIGKLSELLNRSVKTGVFGADMKVSLVNDGPVTIWMDSKEL